MAKGFNHLCQFCSKEYWIKQKRNTKYCSRSCSNKAYPERNLGKKHSAKTIEKIRQARARQTEIMGSPIKGKHHSEETKQKISASKLGKSYMTKEQKELGRQRFLGPNNPRWKGGITDSNRAERIKFRLTMQKIVFERDDYTCVKCNVRGIALQVDHIKSWAKHPELRFNIDNCQTLCMKCHYYKTFKKILPEGFVWGHNLKKADSRIAS